MAFAPVPIAKRQRLGILDSRKPDLNPSAPEPPDLSIPSRVSARRQTAPTEPKPKRKPRSAPSGNYQGYYERRKTARDEPDERLALIPLEWVKGRKVLDVGCNSGAVAVELAQWFGPAKVVGVDIDPGLIRQAKTFADTAWSRQAPLERLIAEAQELERQHSSRSSQSPSLPSLTSDIPDSPFASSDPHYFPISLPRMFGNLPQPRQLVTMFNGDRGESSAGQRRGKRKESSADTRAFPENLQFVAADWVNETIESDRDGYDVLIAFSVTKWIHLSGLNPGLLTFFRRSFDCLRPGGRLILEPQPFSTYARNVKMTPELQENYDRLKEGAEKGWRTEEGDFERVLLELVGFEKRELLGETGKIGSTFRRPVECYTKRGGTARF
ncbi:mepce protein [Rhodotorula toruloides]|uniref:RNA methyltransferase n=1 Tax=Rhodotorula toruloides TaxID=5286 RepID=A0A511KMM7_RHOTO|nr:mepce protein [Rhodotorula toruloides]